MIIDLGKLCFVAAVANYLKNLEKYEQNYYYLISGST